ncbi:tetraacyldisaccharide 4'-kinase [Sphingobacterium paludis]|jgi:tetraacyldisaccharide 4'-kinase|uniref:Tetraacyldisaccharide 4'-kinase n=1 Tax=Sphingobacterium paludis TaxID=1476465 RepID=A0A4R7D5A5_9SPHI|nr:tetraacyldisaccharide 4'-kinase [Sphingobacterium paludis]TDS14895.1 lipid-A-disaccharide kinase [Sphingobacterium paludis]
MILLIRWLLFPFSLLYASVVWLRNRLYDLHVLKSTSFQIPVVVIGNLAVGGTGKSPMVEYVLRTLKSSSDVAVLSRGYGRKTKGFRDVRIDDEAFQSGDEPLQIKRKFPEITVAVCENRVQGIQQLLPHCKAVLLDDAYQHRALKPSFSILLFDYQSLLQPMLPLPTGNFRDVLRETARAHCIVVTKCPEILDATVKSAITAKLGRHSQAPLFFSKIAYQAIQHSTGHSTAAPPLAETTALLVTGIAKPEPLRQYLELKLKHLEHLRYGDHHPFTAADLVDIAQQFHTLQGEHKIIICTEKDLQRLPAPFLAQYPVYFVPIQQQIMFGDAPVFDQLLKSAFRPSEV